jgi:ribosome assembly protein YihI (activator of Der GTPase)
MMDKVMVGWKVELKVVEKDEHLDKQLAVLLVEKKVVYSVYRWVDLMVDMTVDLLDVWMVLKMVVV